jgi:uridine kinase
MAESNIIFLAYLISRHGLTSVRRAFPGVQVVTAAIDSELHEMHLPLNNLIMGEAAGEADFAVQIVDDSLAAGPGDLPKHDAPLEDGTDVSSTLNGEEARDDFKLPVTRAESLKFSRQKMEDGPAAEKRAWVVSPGESVVWSCQALANGRYGAYWVSCDFARVIELTPATDTTPHRL